MAINYIGDDYMYNYSTEEEIFKDVIGYEGKYKVSNKGRVMSVQRRVDKSDGTTQLVKEKIIKLRVNSMGYYQASFGLGKKNKRKHEFVHRLVAKSFLENKEGLLVVNHKDGNPKNNNVENLEWTTHSMNTLHAYENGLISTGKVEVVYPSGDTKIFETYNKCSEFFGFKSHWLQQTVKKKGNIFEYKGYVVKDLGISK